MSFSSNIAALFFIAPGGQDRTVTKTLITAGLGLAAAAMVTLSPGQASAQAPPPPPPPGFEPQAAPAPPGYYVPNSVAQSGPRRIDDWQEGEPIPPGYHPITRIRKGLVIGGAVTFGTVYLINVLAAAIATDTCSVGALGCSTLSALYIPVAGPFVQLGNSHSATGSFGLVFDGLLQAGGAAMLIAGIAAPRTVLIRNDLAGIELTPTPMTFGKTGAGFGFKGTF
jgi:hypothetical protein